MDLQAPVFLLQHVELAPTSEMFKHHAVVTRLDGRVDVMDLDQNCQITTSCFAPGLMLTKASLLTQNLSDHTILAMSPQLPQQLLAMDPLNPSKVRTFSLDFGQITDFCVLGSNHVVVAYNSGALGLYQLIGETFEYQQLLQTGYPLQKLVHHDGDHFSALSDTKALLFAIQENKMAQTKEIIHPSPVRSAAFLPDTDYYIIADRTKVTVYDLQSVNVFVYQSPISINRIQLIENHLHVLAGGMLKIFYIDPKSPANPQELYKTMPNYPDLVSVILNQTTNVWIAFNHVGQYFTIPFHVRQLQAVVPKQYVYINDAFVRPISNQRVLYLNQHGIDVLDYKNRKIIVRLEQQNVFKTFTQLARRDQYENGFNQNFVQDIIVHEFDPQNILMVVSDFYANETKFLLINLDDVCVINLLQEEGRQPHKIAACLKIILERTQEQTKPHILLVFRKKLVRAVVDLDATNVVQFTQAVQIPELRMTSVSGCVVEAGIAIGGFFQNSWYITLFDAAALTIQRQIRTKQVNKLGTLDGAGLVVLEKTLYLMNRAMEVTKQYENITSVVSIGPEFVVCFKAVFRLEGGELQCVQKEKVKEYRYLYHGAAGTFRFFESETFGSYVWIQTKSGDHTKFGHLQ